MVGSVSSANPEKLEHYAAIGENLDQELLSQSNPLTAQLEHFEATCTEPGCRTNASGLGVALRSYGQDLFPFDDWVRQIGRRFAWADGLRLGGRGVSLGRQPLRTPASGFERFWLAQILKPPLWLSLMLAILSWVKSDDTSLEGETELGKLIKDEKSKGPTDAEPTSALPSSETELGRLINAKESIRSESFATPKSIFGDGHRVRASFGTYGGGSLEGFLHNGVDLVPEGYMDGKDYSVRPVGPGRVFKVGTQKDGDDNIIGYGHYVVVQHTLSDGRTVYSRYAHLKEASKLKEGEKVATDTELGLMGSTGRSTGAHVHLEVYNTRAESKWYGSHKPEEQYDEQMTWEQKMKDGYYDPIKVINGDMGWQFKTPNTPEGTT